MSLLLHITDTHLYGDGNRSLKEINTLSSCAAITQHAGERFAHADTIILGGDMSQDGSDESYAHLCRLLEPWQSATFMLTPGNHARMDDIERVLIPSLDRIASYHRKLRRQQWQIIALNSHAEKKVSGLLSDEDLETLDMQLSDTRSHHTLLALHHPPVSIGSRWMDDISLANAKDFWAIVDRHPQVRAVLCGHIHQELDIMRGNVRVLGTPATCIQFKPNCDDFQLDNKSPGYRWLDLLADGTIDTGVERIEGFIPPNLKDNRFY